MLGQTYSTHPLQHLTAKTTLQRAFRSQKPSITTSLTDVSHILEQKNDLPCRVLFKNELEQPSGSFKLRGIGNLIQKSIQQAVEKKASRVQVLASSGGNAGLAAAYASRYYNVPCTVVVPINTMTHVVGKLKLFGAQVVLFGSSINEADVHARHLMEEWSPEVHVIYCHPFDDPLIWKGHSQIVDEMFSQLLASDSAKLKGVVCSVGGGGLYNGIISGLKANNSSAACVLVETKQAPTLTRAVEAGSVVRLDNVRSMATSLACSYVSKPTLELFKNQQTNKSHLLSIDDTEAVRATISYHDDFGSIVEPACGAALSVVYSQLSFLRESLPSLSKEDIVVVVVCGGSCTDEESLAGYRKLLRDFHI